MSDTPEEVQERVDQWSDFNGPGVEHVRFFGKAKWTRGDAWSIVERALPVNPANPKHDNKSNPWRKCHTESYWVWVVPKGDA